MIKVRFRYHDSTRYLRLTVEGHAGSDAIGHDLVCASATILVYTVAQMVKHMEEQGKLVSTPIVELSEGNASIVIRCTDDEFFHEARHTFFVAQTGFALLAYNYPQFVDLKTVGKALIKP